VALDLTQGEENVVRRGDVEADLLGDDYLGAEHLLLGILRDGDNEVARRCAERGVSADAFAQALSSIRRGDSPPSTPAV
jgi:hypothetical protein